MWYRLWSFRLTAGTQNETVEAGLCACSKEDPATDKNQCKPQSSSMWTSQEAATDRTLNPATRQHRIFCKSFLQPLFSFTRPANEASLKTLRFVTPVNQTFQVLIALFFDMISS